MTRQNENRRFALAARARLLARGAEGAASLLEIYAQLQALTDDLIEAIQAETENTPSVDPVSPDPAASPERNAGEATNPGAAPSAPAMAAVPPAAPALAEDALQPMTPAPAPAAEPSGAGAPLRRLRRPRSGALPPRPAGVVWQSPILRMQS